MYLIALAAPSAIAASGDEFYDRLFTRGVAQFNEGNYAGAYSSLRIAAFGYLENIPRFQTAEIYMTVAANKLRHEADARAAAVRVVAAERIEKRYASLAIPAEVRKEFEEAARKLLTADSVAVLRGGGTARPPQPQPQPPPKSSNTIPAPVIVAPPQPQPSKPVPVPTPRVTPPAPQPKLQPQPVPKPVQPQPAPVPTAPAQVQTQPRPVQTAPAQVQTQPRPVPAAPAQVQTQPRPVQPQPQPARPSSDAGALAEADRAVNRGDLAAARSLYRSILDAPQISHATALRVAEGLYRSRDFPGAIRAFERAGAIGSGEEQYHYYYAVALYESGRYSGAKRELRAALPFIEVTPDVERYRVKIEGAIE